MWVPSHSQCFQHILTEYYERLTWRETRRINQSTALIPLIWIFSNLKCLLGRLPGLLSLPRLNQNVTVALMSLTLRSGLHRTHFLIAVSLHDVWLFYWHQT
ncbi:hypothetical protein TNCT_500381 [Trichonephila clavata]|uniref:Uncharacterized protein n=1 Tax=Trichonephila clavata TaxID=2740835 RepID=A0A8X6G7P4_TRICU|nr:hypothetical protein TNCT_500381 [Trichonephila clavata]